MSENKIKRISIGDHAEYDEDVYRVQTTKAEGWEVVFGPMSAEDHTYAATLPDSSKENSSQDN